MMPRLLLAALLLTGCSTGLGGFGEAPPPSPPAPSPASPRPTPTGQSAVRAGPGLRFEPTELRTDAGTVLLLTLANRDERPHTLVIDELNVLMLAGGGQEVTADVHTGPNVRGSFAFYCQVPGHRSGGMEGRIRVTG